MASYRWQALDHESDHADPNHRFAVVGANFVVATKSARLHQPTESSFDDPALGQNLETFSLVTAPHDLQPEFAERTELLHPPNQCSQIATVSPDNLHSAVHAHQQFDEALGRGAVLRRSGGYQEAHDHSLGVPGAVAFASHHLLARVISAFSRLVASLDRLAGPNCRGRC